MVPPAGEPKEGALWTMDTTTLTSAICTLKKDTPKQDVSLNEQLIVLLMPLPHPEKPHHLSCRNPA